MIVKGNFFRDEVDKLWPEVGYQAIQFDRNFYIPTLDEMVAYFKASKLWEMQTVGEMWECDKYSRAFAMEVHTKRYYLLTQGDLPEEKRAPISLACAAQGNMFRGMNVNHVVNLALTEAGIYLFDMMPDAHRYWKANVDNDNVLILVV